MLAHAYAGDRAWLPKSGRTLTPTDCSSFALFRHHVRRTMWSTVHRTRVMRMIACVLALRAIYAFRALVLEVKWLSERAGAGLAPMDCTMRIAFHSFIEWVMHEWSFRLSFGQVVLFDPMIITSSAHCTVHS